MKQMKGFTLMEIMVVILILGILTAMVAANIGGNTEKARKTAINADIQTISSALDTYKMENFRFPTTEQGLEALVNEPSIPPEAKNYKTGGYLRKLPKDPYGNPYQYLYPGERGLFDVFSLGADNEFGGEGEDADIGNWDDEEER
jgi:general secretion pathway protein G